MKVIKWSEKVIINLIKTLGVKTTAEFYQATKNTKEGRCANKTVSGWKKKQPEKFKRLGIIDDTKRYKRKSFSKEEKEEYGFWVRRNRQSPSLSKDRVWIMNTMDTKYVPLEIALRTVYGARCKISGIPVVRGKGEVNLHSWGQQTMDHDEEFQYFRGVLCSPLNLIIGKLRDNPFYALSMAIYLFKGLNERIRIKYETNNKVDNRFPSVIRTRHDG
tara:strand:- start:52 stop:702 length:651 start_codon:yes stop_codon:yes gene_type:complete